jgi:tape measure domain-containing protein
VPLVRYIIEVDASGAITSLNRFSAAAQRPAQAIGVTANQVKSAMASAQLGIGAVGQGFSNMQRIALAAGQTVAVMVPKFTNVRQAASQLGLQVAALGPQFASAAKAASAVGMNIVGMQKSFATGLVPMTQAVQASAARMATSLSGAFGVASSQAQATAVAASQAMQQQVNLVAAAAAGGLPLVQQAMRGSGLAIQGLVTTASQATLSIAQRFQQAFSNISSTVQNALQQAGKSIYQLNAAFQDLGIRLTFLVTVPFVLITKSAIEAAAKLELVQQSFVAITRSIDAGSDLVQALTDLALNLPVPFEAALTGAKRLLAFGFSAQEAAKMVEVLSGAANALGGDLGGASLLLERLILALGQMRAKSTVQAQEMRQLSEAGIRSWEVLAEGLGVTVNKAMDMVEKRMVSGQQGVEIFLKEINKQYGTFLTDIADTTSSQLTIIQNRYFFFKAKLGEAFEEVTKGFLQNFANPILLKLSEIAVRFGELPAPIRIATAAIVGFGAAIGPAMAAVGFLSKAIVDLAVIYGTLRIAGISLGISTVGVIGGLAKLGLASGLVAISLGALIHLYTELNAKQAAEIAANNDLIKNNADLQASLEKTYSVTIKNVSGGVREFNQQLLENAQYLKDATEGKLPWYATSEGEMRLRGITAVVGEVKEEISELDAEIEKLKKSFGADLLPLTALLATQEKVAAAGFSYSQFIEVYYSQIIKAAEAERQHTGAISETGQAMLSAARAVERRVEAEKSWLEQARGIVAAQVAYNAKVAFYEAFLSEIAAKLDVQIQKTALWNDGLQQLTETIDELVPAGGDLVKVMQEINAGEVEGISTLEVLQEKLESVQLARQTAVASGKFGQQQLLEFYIKEIEAIKALRAAQGQWSVEQEVQLRKLKDQLNAVDIAANELAKTEAQTLRDALREVNKVIRDMSSGIAEAIVELHSLVEVFKEVAKGIIRIVVRNIIDQAFRPMLEYLDQIINKTKQVGTVSAASFGAAAGGFPVNLDQLLGPVTGGPFPGIGNAGTLPGATGAAGGVGGLSALLGSTAGAAAIFGPLLGIKGIIGASQNGSALQGAASGALLGVGGFALAGGIGGLIGGAGFSAGAIAGLGAIAGPIGLAITAALAGIGALISQIGKGRREADQIVPIQEQLTEHVTDLRDKIDSAFESGRLDLGTLQSAREEVQKAYDDFVEFTQNFDRAGPGARQTMKWIEDFLDSLDEKGKVLQAKVKFQSVGGAAEGRISSISSEINQLLLSGALTPEMLLDAMKQLDSLIASVTAFGEVIGEGADPLVLAIINSAKTSKEAFQAMIDNWDAIQEALKGILSDQDALAAKVDEITTRRFAPVGNAAVSKINELVSEVSRRLLEGTLTQDFVLVAIERIRSIFDAVRQFGEMIGDAADPLVQAIIASGQEALKAFQQLLDDWEAIKAALKVINPSFAVGPINNNLPIPEFQEGGDVNRTGLAYVHAGEFVLKREAASMFGKSILDSLNEDGARRSTDAGFGPDLRSALSVEPVTAKNLVSMMRKNPKAMKDGIIAVIRMGGKKRKLPSGVKSF